MISYKESDFMKNLKKSGDEENIKYKKDGSLDMRIVPAENYLEKNIKS